MFLEQNSSIIQLVFDIMIHDMTKPFIHQICVQNTAHYSKSLILVQKINFDKTFTDPDPDEPDSFHLVSYTFNTAAYFLDASIKQPGDTRQNHLF